MYSRQINIRLSEDMDQRLERLAARTGRTKTFYIADAVAEYLEDYEDYYLAKDALEEFRQSDDAGIALHEVEWPQ